LCTFDKKGGDEIKRVMAQPWRSSSSLVAGLLGQRIFTGSALAYSFWGGNFLNL